MIKKEKILLLLIIILAAILRFTGLNWDQNQHLHPDERFLTMVADAIKIPQSFSDYLDPQLSSMSPYNKGFDFFVYGTLPLNLTKILAVNFGFDGYSKIYLLGRFLSSLFDLSTLLLTYIICKNLFSKKSALFAALAYSLMVLPIQLSHFFTVDTFLNFFMVLTFYFLVKAADKPRLLYFLGLSFSYGLALSSKVSALYFLPIIGIFFLFILFKGKWSGSTLFLMMIALLSTAISFRLAQPTAFAQSSFLNWQPNEQFLGNLKTLKSMGNIDSWFPPDVYWISRQSKLFALEHVTMWALGIPLGLLSLISLLFSAYRIIRTTNLHPFKNSKTFSILSIIIWVVFLFVYQSFQFTKNLRYFLIIMPFLSVLVGYLLASSVKHFQKFIPSKLYLGIIIILVSIWPLSFISVYLRPHSRILASYWIYENISKGSQLTCEHWDDCLPLNISSSQNPSVYEITQLNLYDPESEEKWQNINSVLANSDYMVITSNRLYGSIPFVSNRYPLTTEFYEKLFGNQLNFTKVAEFHPKPCFLGIESPLTCINDEWAEESFTVYDHPKVHIFKKISLQ